MAMNKILHPTYCPDFGKKKEKIHTTNILCNCVSTIDLIL
jgi:hypothetical protein